MPIDLSKYAQNLLGARDAGRPPILATADAQGHPDIGVKGSIFVYDNDHLAYLERTLGAHLTNLKSSPYVAVFFSNPQSDTPMVRFFGEAQLFESGDKREDIRNRTIPAEVAADKDNQGVGVLIRVDKVIERGTVSTRDS